MALGDKPFICVECGIKKYQFLAMVAHRRTTGHRSGIKPGCTNNIRNSKQQINCQHDEKGHCLYMKQ